ncbi:alanine-tRNA synthetase second additional domain-containing protein [Natroniella sp. ANB-PHB2]|uniref:alanine-tRNA synthetase second additional domain-containing protein n=1 Tax=Natroniella sp. ANB-PHB2 TaxID=3384444 RepID=UPI0038D39E82
MITSFAQSIYFAPRGKKRLMRLGNQISQRYMDFDDRLIGLIGEGGAGKSLLIRGMFPGLCLTNDDRGINIRPLPLLDDVEKGDYSSHTYHLDARFETAFAQPWQLAEAIKEALKNEKTVVIEHFDLLEKHLDLRADMLIGIGEEVLVTRPGLFGPYPKEIADIVFESIRYRWMAHTAEILTVGVLKKKLGRRIDPYYSDIKSGFVLQFNKKIEFDITKLEQEVKNYIAQDLPVKYHDDEHIKIGEEVHLCSGPRINVNRTGQIKGFKLKDLQYDSKSGLYLLAGLVGEEKSQFKLSQI